MNTKTSIKSNIRCFKYYRRRKSSTALQVLSVIHLVTLILLPYMILIKAYFLWILFYLLTVLIGYFT